MDASDTDRLLRIFHPFAMAKRDEARATGRKFVHYTGPDAAMKILRNKEVWMRKSSTMNDFSEIEHGLGCLNEVWKSETANRFKEALEGAFPGIVGELETSFRGWRPHFQLETYLTCISEHDSAEDHMGRLSMWRAYGEIAIVLNQQVFMSETDALAAYSSPVNYLSQREFSEKFSRIVQDTELNRDFIATHNRQLVFNIIFEMLRNSVLCTKHPAFKEEREWRIYYAPTFQPSNKIKKSIETVRGLPQPVCKISLTDSPQDGLIGMEIPALIDRIIVGPTEYPWVMAEAFMTLLSEAGVSDAPSRVAVSGIPLRQ